MLSLYFHWRKTTWEKIGLNLDGILIKCGSETGVHGISMNVSKKCLIITTASMISKESEEDSKNSFCRNSNCQTTQPVEMTNEMVIVENSLLKKSMMTEKYFTLNIQMFIMKMKRPLMQRMEIFKRRFLFMIFLIRTYLKTSMSSELILWITHNHIKMDSLQSILLWLVLHIKLTMF